jgi:C4-dicarboxylate-specific signal transduction histidine kinase
MVNEAVELADIELRRRNVRLTPLRGRAPAPLHGDPILIEQVLVNLMKNAPSPSSMPNARPRAAVELRVVPKHHGKASAWSSFRCTDTGKGLAPKCWSGCLRPSSPPRRRHGHRA